MTELSLGNYHYCRREYADATERYRRARDIGRDTGWTKGEAAAESALATVYSTAGDLERAVERFEACLALVDEPPPATLNNLAGTLMSLGRLADATDRCLAALAGYRASGVRLGEAMTRTNLAMLLCLRGEYGEAREHATDSLQVGVEWDRLDTQALAHLALAMIDRKTGALASAAKHAERAFDLSATLRDIRLECLAHSALAPAYRELGRTRAALTHDEAAIRLARQIPSRYTVVESTTSLAATYAVLREPDRARQLAMEAVAEAETAGFRVLRDDALMVLAGLA
jgi:tetratricopeptide (TPR) repeat protein